MVERSEKVLQSAKVKEGKCIYEDNAQPTHKGKRHYVWVRANEVPDFWEEAKGKKAKTA